MTSEASAATANVVVTQVAIVATLKALVDVGVLNNEKALKALSIISKELKGEADSRLKHDANCPSALLLEGLSTLLDAQAAFEGRSGA